MVGNGGPETSYEPAYLIRLGHQLVEQRPIQITYIKGDIELRADLRA